MLRLLGGITLAAAAVTFAWATQSQTQPPPAVARSDPAAPILHRTAGRERPVDGEWFDRIFESPRRHIEPEPKRPRRHHYNRSKGGTYRTLCVRLCDGFYFPISYSTLPWRFAADAQRCEQSCPTKSRLFVHRNPGQGVDAMVDLHGHPYASLPTAFLHRIKYVADCTCRGNPWDEVAVARHRALAEATKLTAPGNPAAPRVRPERSMGPRIGQARRGAKRARRRAIFLLPAGVSLRDPPRALDCAGARPFADAHGHRDPTSRSLSTTSGLKAHAKVCRAAGGLAYGPVRRFRAWPLRPPPLNDLAT